MQGADPPAAPKGDHGDRWKLAAAVVPVVLAIGAALIYGLLVLAYSEFYRELGVRPGDVGLDYGRGIGGAAGITIALLAVAGIAAILYLALLGVGNRRSRDFSKGGLALVALVAIGVVCVVGVVPFARFANSRADQVKNGRALEPIGFLGVEMLAVRADPAKLQPIGRSPAQLKLLRRVRDHRLFYLGRSATTMVIYDQTTQRALYLPAATIMVETSNCETSKNLDDECKRLRE